MKLPQHCRRNVEDYILYGYSLSSPIIIRMVVIRTVVIPAVVIPTVAFPTVVILTVAVTRSVHRDAKTRRNADKIANTEAPTPPPIDLGVRSSGAHNCRGGGRVTAGDYILYCYCYCHPSPVIVRR